MRQVEMDKNLVHGISEIRNVALLLSHENGKRVADFFSSRKEEKVVAVYFEERGEYSEEVLKKLAIEEDRAFYGRKILADENHVGWLRKQNVDFLVTVYWPWLLSDSFYKSVKNTLNFHPALLPINRGWYPHVHSIIDGSKCGVTLHQISTEADAGDVWVQKEVQIGIHETAKNIYLRLQNEIFDLFSSSWDDITTGQCSLKPQDHSQASYHAKGELTKLDLVKLDELSGRELFNLLRARSFGDNGFAYIESDGKKLFLNLRISDGTRFK